MNEYLCGYVEHLNENQWELYKGLARTKEAQFFEQRGMEHHRIDLPRNDELNGLLCMGVSNKAYPFSWGARGLPQVLSSGLEGIIDKLTMPPMIIGWSYLTREELLTRSAKLLIHPDKQARQVRPALIELIKKLPEWDGDPKHQRIVFWFH